MGGVVKTAKKAVSWIGDAIENIADFVVDDIIEPVFDTIGNVVQGMINDPLTTIATIGATVTGFGWAVPFIQGASVAAKGGDPEDIAAAFAVSYLGGKAGSWADEIVGGSVGSVAGEAIGDVASKAAEYATRGALTAAITGRGDVLDSALQGLVMGGITGGLQELSKVDTTASASAEQVSGTWGNTVSSVKKELGSVSKEFNELPEIVRDVITSGAGAAITSLAMTGELDSGAVGGAIANAAITSKAMVGLLSETGLSDRNASVVAAAMGNAVRAGYTGVDPYAAVMATFGAQGMKDLGQKIDDITQGGLDRVFDAVTGATSKFVEAGKVANEKAGAVNTNADKVNSAAEALDAYAAEHSKEIEDFNAKVDKNNSLREDYEQQQQAVVNANNNYKAMVADFNALKDKREELNLSLEENRRNLSNYESTWTDEDGNERSVTPQEKYFVGGDEETPGVWVDNSDYATYQDLRAQRQAIDGQLSVATDLLREAATNIKPAQELLLSLITQRDAAAEAYKTYSEGVYDAAANAISPVRTELDRLRGELQSNITNYNTTRTEYDAAVTAYNTAKDDMVTNQRYLSDAIVPVQQLANKVVVNSITANPRTGGVQFNPEEYAKLYNLPEGVDPYSHFLDTGRTNAINRSDFIARQSGLGGQVFDPSTNKFVTYRPNVAGTGYDFFDSAGNILSNIGAELFGIGTAKAAGTEDWTLVPYNPAIAPGIEVYFPRGGDGPTGTAVGGAGGTQLVPVYDDVNPPEGAAPGAVYDPKYNQWVDLKTGETWAAAVREYYVPPVSGYGGPDVGAGAAVGGDGGPDVGGDGGAGAAVGGGGGGPDDYYVGDAGSISGAATPIAYNDLVTLQYAAGIAKNIGGSVYTGYDTLLAALSQNPYDPNAVQAAVNAAYNIIDEGTAGGATGEIGGGATGEIGGGGATGEIGGGATGEIGTGAGTGTGDETGKLIQQLLNTQQLYGMLSLPGQTTSTATTQSKETPLADIKYFYDPFSTSIFATPEQERKFINPYESQIQGQSETGDVTDRIMNILGSK